MNSKIIEVIGILLGIALLLAGIFSVTFSTLTQSVPVFLVSAAGILIVYHILKRGVKEFHPLLWLFVFAWLYFIIRGLFSSVAHLARQDLFLICTCGIMYLACVLPVGRHRVKHYIVVSALILMVINILMVIPSVNSFRDSLLGYAKGTSVTGLYNHRNFLGNFMTMCTLLTMSMAMCGKLNRVKKIILLVLSALGVILVGLSEARMSYIALCGGAAVLAIILVIISYFKGVNRKKLTLRVLVITLIAFAMGVGGNIVLENRAEKGANKNLGKFQSSGRVGIFATVVDQIPDAPLLGSGSRSVEYLAYQNWSPMLYNSRSDFKFAHNEYLQAIADYGLLGCVLIITLLLGHMYFGYQYFIDLISNKNESIELNYCIAGIVIVIAMMINMLGSFPAHSLSNLMLFAVACSLLVPPKRIKKTKLSVYIITFILFCVSIKMVVSGGKELLAGTKFWKYGIAEDSLNWNVREAKEKNWEHALEEAIQIAPTFNRYNRLGNILMAESSDSEIDQMEEKRKSALSIFKKAKVLHPFDPVCRINIAKLYSLLGEHSLAEKEYEGLEYIVEKREEVFSFYQHRAENLLRWGIKVLAENKIEDAITLANEAVYNSEKSRDKMLGRINSKLEMVLLESYLLHYYSILAKEKRDGSKLVESITAFDKYAKMQRLLWKKPEFLERHALQVLAHGKLLNAEHKLERKDLKVRLSRKEISELSQRAMNTLTLAKKELVRVNKLRKESRNIKIISVLDVVLKDYRSVSVQPDYQFPYTDK